VPLYWDSTNLISLNWLKRKPFRTSKSFTFSMEWFVAFLLFTRRWLFTETSSLPMWWSIQVLFFFIFFIFYFFETSWKKIHFFLLLLFFAEKENGETYFVPYIGDFGISAFSKKMTIEGNNFRQIFGISQRYAAPEVFERMYVDNLDPVDIENDQRSDVYSFAIVVYELVIACFFEFFVLFLYIFLKN